MDESLARGGKDIMARNYSPEEQSRNKYLDKSIRIYNE
jgi:hypothetical protein